MSSLERNLMKCATRIRTCKIRRAINFPLRCLKCVRKIHPLSMLAFNLFTEADMQGTASVSIESESERLATLLIKFG